MGILGDDEHPDPSATALHKILDCIMVLIGIGLFIFAVYNMYVLKAASFFAIIILVVGIGLVGFSILGFFGSGYYKPGEKEGRLLCLRIFWLAVLLFAAILFMFGGICLVSQETIESYVLVYYGQFTSMTNQFDGQAGAMMQQLTALLNNFKILGGVAIGIGVFMILCFLCSSYLMGMRIFLLTCAFYGSIGVAAIGGVIIALSIYFQSYTEIMNSISKILFGGIVLGIVSILCGAAGVVAYCLHKKLPIVLKLFTVVIAALAIAYLVVGILSFSLTTTLDANDNLRNKVKDHCSQNTTVWNNGTLSDVTGSPCYDLMVNSITFECQKVRNEEMKDEVCPFDKKKNDSDKPGWPNCLCAGSTEAYISQFLTLEEFVNFSYVTNKKSVVSNYKILGMLGIMTCVLLVFIGAALLVSCVCYAHKLDKEDDKYEWVWEDEVDEKPGEFNEGEDQ